MANTEHIVQIDQDLYMTQLLSPEDAALRGATAAAVVAPTLTTLAPATVAVGANPLTSTLTGANFHPTSKVIWNGGYERSGRYVSATQMTVGIDPRTASGAFTVPVTVQTGAQQSAPRNFAFTEA